jgi:hypothetical protein
VNDVSHTIVSLLYNDQNNLVKQKCAWSFANLTEILLENKSINPTTHEYLNHNLYFKLVKCSYELCSRESEKIKSYLVRTLGNLLNYLDDNLIGQFDSSEMVNACVTSAIRQLIACKNTKMLKVKWNLCYSIGMGIKSTVTFDAHWSSLSLLFHRHLHSQFGYSVSTGMATRLVQHID